MVFRLRDLSQWPARQREMLGGHLPVSIRVAMLERIVCTGARKHLKYPAGLSLCTLLQSGQR